MYEKRRARGLGSLHALLVGDQVVIIKARLAMGETHRNIAADYGIARSTVSGINTGRKWGWVEAKEA